MDKNDIKYIDKLLKALLEFNKPVPPFSTDINEKIGNSSKFIETCEKLMTDEYKLVLKTSGGYFGLTREGEKAAEIGIQKYFDNLEYLKQLDVKSKIIAIETSKKSLKFAKIAIVLAVIIPFLILFTDKHYDKIINSFIKDSKNDWLYNRNSKINSAHAIISGDTISNGLLKIKLDSIKLRSNNLVNKKIK
jgi:hypothetical protein